MDAFLITLANDLEDRLGIEIPRGDAETRDYCVGYWLRVADAPRCTINDATAEGWDAAQDESADWP